MKKPKDKEDIQEEIGEVKEKKPIEINDNPVGNGIMYRNIEKGNFKLVFKGTDEYNKIKNNKAFEKIKEI